MKGYKRSLTFWGYTMEQYFLIIMGTILIISFVLGRGGDFFEILPTYLPMMGVICIMAQAFNAPVLYIPQGLSLGATRKEILVGMEIMLHVVALQMVLVLTIVIRVMPDSADLGTLPELFRMEPETGLAVLGGIYLFLCGIGNGICAATLRNGAKIGLVVYMVFTLVIVFGMIFLMSFSIMSKFVNFKDILDFVKNFGLIVAAVIDVGMIALNFTAIKKYEVKA